MQGMKGGVDLGAMRKESDAATIIKKESEKRGSVNFFGDNRP